MRPLSSPHLSLMPLNLPSTAFAAFRSILYQLDSPYKRSNTSLVTACLMTATASVPQSGNEADSLPILSYRLLADPATRQQFITQLRRTLRTVGFFYLVDFEDAVRTELYNDVARHVQDFWRLPHETR